MKHCFLTVGAIVCTIALIGCGGGGAKTLPVVKVSGKLLVDGKPTGNCTINFSPILEDSDPNKNLKRNAGGSVKPDGTFTLTTYTPNDGVVAGKYSVTIGTDMANMKMEPVPAVVPAMVEVTSSTTQLEVALKGTGKTLVGIGTPAQTIAAPP